MIKNKINLKEKCGIVAVWDNNNNAPYLTRLGLAALQHRGLESAGISAYSSDNKIITYKGMGLVTQVLTDKIINIFGNCKITTGQTRYSTSGESILSNAHPIDLKNKNYHITVGHNGNIPDISNILKILGAKIKVTSDTAAIAKLLLKKRPLFENWEQALIASLPNINGAFNLNILTELGDIFVARDTFGIRPLCLGRLKDGWIIASESVALDTTGADFVRDVAPGEIIKIDKNGNLSSSFFGVPKRHQFCLFEYIYFARPDSFMNGKRVKAGRERSGMFLGERIKEKKLKPDIAIPVFDSGYPAAKGVARELKIPLVDAITTSHYIGRTFIKPGQQNREAAVGGKHNVVSDEVFGKKVVVVDDSGVRLTTSIVLAKALKKAGAEEIYFAFASPPVIKQCDLGIDMRSKNELPAAKYVNKSLSIIEKEISKIIKANEVIYLSIDKTAEAMGGMKEEFYYTPFGGPHPIRDNQTPIPKMKKKLSKKPKLSIFISGSGTNLQQIINAIESNYLDAEIIDVLSNKNDAYGLIRAKKHELRSTVIPYTEKLSNKSARSTYSKKLIEHIKRTKPDLIILAGWLMVLDDNFLQELQNMEIPVINLHPALMTPILDETIQTSKGRIPVLRGWGMNVIKPPFENKLLLSGITVHQILPKNKYDVGPIIMKAEVHRKPDDNLASWEKKIHDTEHMLLPTAVKRVLHVMKNGIDISKGEYAW